YPGVLQPAVDSKIIDVLWSIVQQVEMEELTSQDRAVQEARKRELYWRGIQATFWNEVGQRYDEITPQTEAEAEAMAKIVNVYKADGESIAAAIASSVPAVRFFPDDADNPDDILTAKAETRLSEKIAKDNSASMLMFQIMYTLWTEPFAAANINYVEDPSFGYRVVPLYQKKEVTLNTPVCAQCGFQMGPQMPADGDMGAGMGEGLADPAEMMPVCPDCGGTEITQQPETVDMAAQTGEVELPEGRAVIDIYGISNVRIPFYCRTQQDIPYIFLDTDQHYSLLRDIFPHIKDKILPGGVSTGEAQQGYRQPVTSSKQAEIATCRRVWLRPWVFQVLDDDIYAAELALLKERFPNGIVIYYVNDIFACAFAAGIDDQWVFTKHPMSRYIHNVPLGDAIIPIQDMTNEATNLFLDLILNSVPPMFVNPDVVNFDKLGSTRQLPGTWIKAKPKIPGQPLDPNFYTPKPPTMSQYLPTFFTMLDARRQHVGGAFPSIYGGAAISGSKTKGEYDQSRSSALQRLGIVWKMINVFWPKVMELAVRCFRKNMADDVKDVQRSGTDFVNVWIRKSEMSGRVGRVESESSEEFPVAWSQIRGILIELLGLGIPQINEAIINPDNIEFLKKVIGLPELHIAGEDDRTYQLSVIQQLLQSPPMGAMSSVPPDPNVVDIEVAIAVTQAWIKSDQGQEV
ncbi:MAG TPA: hypothetical protein VIY48_18540, partial [Candidatus Paceibacterota bacterium]